MAAHSVARTEQVDVDENDAWESRTFLSALADATSRILLDPLVAATSFRNPALLAKMADALDEISDGRSILGLGSGWHKPEHDAVGITFDHLTSRFEEALRTIRPLLRDGRVDFAGASTMRATVRCARAGPPLADRRQTPVDAGTGRTLRERLEYRLAPVARDDLSGRRNAACRL